MCVVRAMVFARVLSVALKVECAAVGGSTVIALYTSPHHVRSIEQKYFTAKEVIVRTAVYDFVRKFLNRNAARPPSLCRRAHGVQSS